MICKLFIEDGDYLDKTTGEPRNLFCATEIHTPEGESDSWVGGFRTLDEVMEHFNIEPKPIPEEDEELNDLNIR